MDAGADAEVDVPGYCTEVGRYLCTVSTPSTVGRSLLVIPVAHFQACH